MPRQIFKRCVIAVAGPLPGQLSVENIRHWTQLRKGRFSDSLTDEVTHLLCTSEQFNKRVRSVKDALSMGRRLHIVHYDWFEFSTAHEKKEPEAEYSMRKILAEQNAARREKARIERGKRNGEKFVNTNLFHIYHDREFFPYKIDITRDDEATGEIGQRYTLCLWESDAKPPLYWFTAKFLKKKGNSQPSYYRPSPCSRKWRDEMDLFMEFFHIKTGIEWQDRVLKEKTMPPSYFQYSPPGGGKPVGRRLRFQLEYCREINAQLRGLPWPPTQEQMTLPDSEQELLCTGNNDHATPEVNNISDMEIRTPSDRGICAEGINTGCSLDAYQINGAPATNTSSDSSSPNNIAEIQPVMSQETLMTGIDPDHVKHTDGTQRLSKRSGIATCFGNYYSGLRNLSDLPTQFSNVDTFRQRDQTYPRISGGEGRGSLPNIIAPSLDYIPSAEGVQYGFDIRYPGTWVNTNATPACAGSSPPKVESPRSSSISQVRSADDYDIQKYGEDYLGGLKPPPAGYTPSAMGVHYGFDIQYPSQTKLQ